MAQFERSEWLLLLRKYRDRFVPSLCWNSTVASAGITNSATEMVIVSIIHSWQEFTTVNEWEIRNRTTEYVCKLNRYVLYVHGGMDSLPSLTIYIPTAQIEPLLN